MHPPSLLAEATSASGTDALSFPWTGQADPAASAILPIQDLPTPCYVIDLVKLRSNMQFLDRIQHRANCNILLALKGFATWSVFEHMSPYLAGCCASGVWEAQLAREKFGREIHAYAPAFTPEDVTELLGFTDHLTFNSLSQWNRFRSEALSHPRSHEVEFGLRINPQCSTGKVPLYDPCAPHSRLGITAEQLASADLNGITGLHCHTLCQQNSTALEFTLAAIEEQFAPWLPKMRWFNMGGGHHITKPDYDADLLVKLVRDFSQRWDLQVYLEPGEAHVVDAGYLVASVLDVIHNGMDIAILDISATAHMPDVLEMPYRPPVSNSGKPGEKPFTYRLGAPTCLSGDVMGDYSFDKPLEPGDRIVFEDQAQYTMVKTTMFNGIKHPAIATWNSETGEVSVVKEFGYEDFRDRLS